MDSLDQYIQGVVTKEIYEPEDYIRAIKSSLDSKDRHHKYFSLYKVAIIVICLLFTSGIAYATYNYVKNNFNRRKGIETAINNGYIMNVDGEPVTSNDISLKIDQILLDDYNLDISFDLEFKNMEIPEDVQAVRFESILITDNNKHILFFTGNQNIFNNFIKSNNFTNNFYINSSSSIRSVRKDSNKYTLVYNISAAKNIFPRSKSLSIYVSNIVLKNNNKETLVKSNLTLNQQLISNFQNRSSVRFIPEDATNENIIDLKLTTYNTGTNLEMELKSNYKLEEAKKIKELIEKATNENQSYTEQNIEYYNGMYQAQIEEEIKKHETSFHNLVNNIYIENSHGEKFYITNKVNTSENIYRFVNGSNLLYSNIFDMTNYNCTDRLSLHFTYNGENYNVNLISVE